VNVTVPSLANITSGSCVIDGIETINLSLVDTTPAYQVWQAVWMVHNVSMGEYVATITLIDQENTSYYAEGEWSVLPEEPPGEAQQNETQNGTFTPTNLTTENQTVDISNISTDGPLVFESVSPIETGKPVQWRQRFEVNNTLTVNITGFAYNISVDGVDSKDEVIVLKNIRKNLKQYNHEKEKESLAKEIKDLLLSNKRYSTTLPSRHELYQLYRMSKHDSSFEQIFNETYDEIKHNIDQFIQADDDVQLILSNITGTVEVTYYTEAPRIFEKIIDESRKQITVHSDMHYENVFASTSIVESSQSSVQLFWIMNESYVRMRNATYLDTNGNGYIDTIEWIIPHLSNQTFEIVITKAEHLNENREFLTDVYPEVDKKDGIWSQPIYHQEYVRVTFESNLTKDNDITLYVRNTQGLDTIVEVYSYNSDVKITEFPIIGKEDFYQVYLTEMTGEHRTFDLRIKNLDNNNSAYLEFDYIVDPTGWISPTGAADPSSQWTNEARAYDENTATYASHTAAVGWQGYLELTLGSAIYCDRVRVYSDFDAYYTDKVSIDVYNTSGWIEKYNGTISNCVWTEVEFGAESNVTKARFRYHYIRGSVIFWFYEFDFWQGQPLTLPNGTTLAVTSIDETTAILKGNITDDGGEPCEYRFQYGSNTSYGTNTTWGGSEATGSEFNTMIHGLTLGNTYQYRVQIRNDVGTINGSNKNFTTAAPALGWVTPTSHYDPNSHWTNEDRAYDNDLDTYTDSYHAINDPDGVWSFFIYLNHSALICDKVRFYARGPTGDPAQVDQVDVDVCRGGVWVNVYEGTFTDKTWVEKGFTQGSVNQSRIRFRINAANGGLYYQLYGFDFNNSRPVPMIMNESPTNKSWGVSLLPQLNITVMNPDGTAMTITWSSNSSGSWQVFGTNSSVTNGTYHQLNTNFSSNNTKYWWKIYVTDGTDCNSTVYYFSITDILPPSSTVVAITPYWKNAATITATATDTGWSGLKNVTLYYRYSADNSSWGGWVNAGVDTASPWSWSFAFSNGTGYYQFYSIAVDNATNTESAPGTADAKCGYENTAPSSSVSAITTYWKTSAPQTITGTASDIGPSGLKNVTLWYRYRATNSSSWGSWTSSGLIDTDPWVAISWSFTFSSGNGLYEFYSIAKDNATNAEAAPASADASCGYDSSAPFSSIDGNIGNTVTDRWEYDAEEGHYPDVIRLGTSLYYAIVSTGDSGTENDGYLRTMKVWTNNGTIQRSLVDSFEYDTSDGRSPQIVHVSGDIYAICYYDATSLKQTLLTISIDDANGDIAAAATDIQLLTYNGVNASICRILHVTGDVFAVMYSDSTTDLWLETWNISSSGVIADTFADSVEINGADGIYPDMCLVDSNTVAIVYDAGTAGGNDGFLLTRNISATGDITNTNASTWEFDASRAANPSIIKTSGNIFAIAYEDTNADIYIKTCQINNTGSIWKTWKDTQAIDTTNGDFSNLFAVTSKIFGVSFAGDGGDGYISTVDIETTGAIGYEIDTIEFDAADNLWYAPVLWVSGNYYLIVWAGTGNDGFACTVTITSNGVSYWKKTSPLVINGTAVESGPAGLKNVTLWYRFSVDNSSWGGWVNSGLVDTDPWVLISWSFPFFNNTGYYQFYSIARDNATNTESAPVSFDTLIRYTNVTVPIVITNASTGVEETNATIWGYLQSNGGENCTVRFVYGTSMSYGTNTTNQTKTTGQTFSAEITSLTKGQLYHYRSFANNTLQSDSGDDMTFLTRPDPPNTLNAQPNSSVIYLTWNTGTGANTTYIERNASGQTIWTRGQGEFVYNGSATNYEDNGCIPGTTYYYQAWSFTTWASNPSLFQYSYVNDSSSAMIAVNISIGVTPLAWDQGTILIGDSNATSGLYFNLTNQGNVPMNIQIKASNATNATTGAQWNLTGSPGLNNFSLQYKRSGDTNWTIINLTYDNFMLNLPATGADWLTFDLNLIMATTSSTTDPLSLSITIKSVAA